MRKIIGITYLHSHPLMEERLSVDIEHVIVDKEDWKEVVEILTHNQDLIPKVDKFEAIKLSDNRPNVLVDSMLSVIKSVYRCSGERNELPKTLLDEMLSILNKFGEETNTNKSITFSVIPEQTCGCKEPLLILDRITNIHEKVYCKTCGGLVTV